MNLPKIIFTLLIIYLIINLYKDCQTQQIENNEAYKEKSEYLPKSRETKRFLQNKTTIVNRNPKDEQMIIER